MTLRSTTAILWLGLVLAYNVNGREIGSTDTLPTKFAARALALSGSLRLGHLIGEHPGLADRAAFARDRQGNWRSAYPVLPAVLAAPVAFVLFRSHLVDPAAALGANLVAAVSASVLVATAVAIVFLALVEIVDRRAALLTAGSLGLATNYWLMSRALTGQETVALGMALALWAGTRDLTAWRAAAGGIGLAIAGAARPQTAPLVAGMALWLTARAPARTPAVIVPIAVAAAMTVWMNVHWFGSVLGGTTTLETMHWFTHRVHGPLADNPALNAAGLLVSPSRGLLVFTPLIVIAALGIPGALRRRACVYEWLLLAAGAQFAGYACYSVWWGGHTYGPRYALDLLVPLTPFAAIGYAEVIRASRSRCAVAAALLLWSCGVAALGVFVYPNESWNSDPADVDTHHARLWELADSQLPRALRAGPSPHNFDLYSRAAFRKPSAPTP